LTKKEYLKNLKILKNVLGIFFSILCFGCINTNVVKEKWPIPQKPKLLPVEIVSIIDVIPNNDGFYMNKDQAKILVDNIDLLKSYNQKLELLITTLSKYYNFKLEEIDCVK